MNSRKNYIILLLIVILVSISSYTAISGLSLGSLKVPAVKEKIDLGLDLAGGVYVILEANTKDTGKELSKKMEQSKSIIRQRVDSLGVAEPNIAIEGEKRIRIELAGVKDAEQAFQMIGKTAQLQFVDPDGNIVITGKNIKESDITFQQTDTSGSSPVVSLKFDDEGAKAFKEATARLAKATEAGKNILYIKLDDKVISSPGVSKEIPDGSAVIEGGFTIESAKELSNLIRAGALPVELKEVQTSVIGPTLGLEALSKSVKAGAIGVAVIFLFMLIVYRGAGMIANICLSIYIIITLTVMGIIGVKLTLPGIAGLILSIGMAVDANIVIFERIREELKDGNSTRIAVEKGYSRALSSVIDSNVTTFIAGAVLYYLGSGPIKGFGVTLIIGLLVSVLTAVFINKYLLRLMANTNIGKNSKLFGA